MNGTSRPRVWWLACLGLCLLLTTGCQTWFGGMTLPSGHYLEHPPQYFAPSPAFPLNRELAYQERVWSAPAGGGVNPGPGLPGVVPPGVGPGGVGPGGLPPGPGPGPGGP